MFICEIIETFVFNGVLDKQKYSTNNVGHRVYGPAIQQWNRDGSKFREDWVIDSKWHRVDGPAIQLWRDDGNIWREEWYVHKELHRVDGPALSQWNDDGVLEYQLYSLYGVEITEKIKEWANTIGIPDIMNMAPEHHAMFKLTWGY